MCNFPKDPHDRGTPPALPSLGSRGGLSRSLGSAYGSFGSRGVPIAEEEEELEQDAALLLALHRGGGGGGAPMLMLRRREAAEEREESPPAEAVAFDDDDLAEMELEAEETAALADAVKAAKISASQPAFALTLA